MPPPVTKVVPFDPKERTNFFKLCVFSALQLAGLGAFAYHPCTLIGAGLLSKGLTCSELS